jgi:hypothetical protein
MPMKLRSLMAIKPHKYGTRHLTAGEQYEAPPRHAIALVAGKKARFADKAVPLKAKAEVVVDEPADAAAITDLVEYMKPQTIVGQFGGDDEPEATIDSLRMEATQLGIDVDGRWGVVRLRHEIAQAKR